MTLIETIDKFLKSVSESSYDIYKNKINVFYKFLIEVKKITDGSYQSYLEAMKIHEIEESLDYYISTNKIRSESVAWNYISVIKRYFNYIYKLGIQNNNLIKSFSLPFDNIESFQYKINEKIFKDTRLDKKESKDVITQEEAEQLISECDEQIKELLEEGDILNYNKYPTKYNDFLASIIIKILLFTGIRYKVLKSIKFNDLSTIHNTLTINGYTIHLPNKLSEQLLEYKEIRYQVAKDIKVKSNALFIYADGNELRKQTDVVSGTLKEYMGRGDITGITKYEIIEMIRKGINQSVIQDFTKVGLNIYNYCQNEVNKSKNQSASKYLDSKLRGLEIFDKM